MITLSLAELIFVAFRFAYGRFEDLRHGTRCEFCDDELFEERLFAYIVLPLMTLFIIALLRVFVRIFIRPQYFTYVLISGMQAFTFVYLLTGHMDRYLYVTLANPVAIIIAVFAVLNINVIMNYN